MLFKPETISQFLNLFWYVRSACQTSLDTVLKLRYISLNQYRLLCSVSMIKLLMPHCSQYWSSEALLGLSRGLTQYLQDEITYISLCCHQSHPHLLEVCIDYMMYLLSHLMMTSAPHLLTDPEQVKTQTQPLSCTSWHLKCHLPQDTYQKAMYHY